MPGGRRAVVWSTEQAGGDGRARRGRATASGPARIPDWLALVRRRRRRHPRAARVRRADGGRGSSPSTATSSTSRPAARSGQFKMAGKPRARVDPGSGARERDDVAAPRDARHRRAARGVARGPPLARNPARAIQALVRRAGRAGVPRHAGRADGHPMGGRGAGDPNRDSSSVQPPPLDVLPHLRGTSPETSSPLREPLADERCDEMAGKRGRARGTGG